MKWVILIHLLMEGGYGGQTHEIYPHSFQTKVDCEALLNTNALHRYASHHHFKGYDRDSFYGDYGECVSCTHEQNAWRK